MTSFILLLLCLTLLILIFVDGGYIRNEEPNSLPYIGKVYVINLEKRSDRMKSISNILDDLRIPFERFEAFDFDNGNDLALKKAYNRFAKGTKFNATLVQEYLKSNGDDHKTWGSAGCWQSHLQIAMKIVAEKIPGPYLFLEDDIRVSPQIIPFLSYENMFIRLPSDWDVLLLDSYDLRCYPSRMTSDNKTIPNGICKVKHSFTTSGYVVRNLEAIQKFITFGNTAENQVIDHYWNDMFAKQDVIAYAPFKKIVSQAMDQFSSDVKRSQTVLKKVYKQYKADEKSWSRKPHSSFRIA